MIRRDLQYVQVSKLFIRVAQARPHENLLLSEDPFDLVPLEHFLLVQDLHGIVVLCFGVSYEVDSANVPLANQCDFFKAVVGHGARANDLDRGRRVRGFQL